MRKSFKNVLYTNTTFRYLSSRAFALVVFAALIVSSCNKDSLVDEHSLISTPTTNLTEQGFLQFTDQETFTQMIRQLESQGHPISFLAEKFPGFTSYTDVYNSLDFEQLEESGAITSLEDYKKYPVTLQTGSDGELSVEPIIDGYYLGLLADKNGVIQLANKVFQVTRNYVFIDEYENVKDFTDLAASPTVVRQKIDRAAGLISDARYQEQCTDEYTWGGKDHRLIGNWVTANAGLYQDITVATKHQKRGFLGAWYANREQYIEVSGDVNYSQNGVPGVISKTFFESETNAADVKRVLEWCSGVSCGFEFEPGSESDHSSYDTGTSAACQLTN